MEGPQPFPFLPGAVLATNPGPQELLRAAPHPTLQGMGPEPQLEGCVGELLNYTNSPGPPGGHAGPKFKLKM